MAGIREAMKRVMDGRNGGTVIGSGVLQRCNCDGSSKCVHCGELSVRYVIIELRDGGRITAYDEGDIRLSEELELGMDVRLNITSNWTAEWRSA